VVDSPASSVVAQCLMVAQASAAAERWAALVAVREWPAVPRTAEATPAVAIWVAETWAEAAAHLQVVVVAAASAAVVAATWVAAAEWVEVGAAQRLLRQHQATDCGLLQKAEGPNGPSAFLYSH
jgi:hypothetical protein